MGLRKPALVIISLSLGTGPVSHAGGLLSTKGTDTRGPLILSLEPGARNAGVAGAFSVTSGDGEALYGNPAGLQRLTDNEFRASGGTIASEQTQTSVSFTHPFWRHGERETWGAYLHRLSMDSFDVYESGETVGVAQPEDWVAAVAYARPAPFGNWGMALKGVGTRTFESHGKTAALDVGVQGGDHRGGWGAAVSNVGPSMNLGGRRMNLPTEGRVGIHRRWSHLTAALMGEFTTNGQPVGAGGVETEAAWANRWSAALRAGVRTSKESPFALGAGVTRGSLSVQYAFSALNDQEYNSQLDVVIRFGGEPPQETRRRNLLEVAEREMNQGHFGEAQSALDDVFSISPHHHKAIRMRRELRLRISETLDPDTLLDLGRQEVKAGRDEEASDIYRKLLIVHPGHEQGKKELEEIESRMARRRADRLREEVAKTRSLELARRLREIQNLESHKKWAEALAVRLTMNRSDKDNIVGIERCRAALYEEGDKAVLAGDTARAIALFRETEREGSFRDAKERVHSLEKKAAAQRAEKSMEKYRLGQAAFLKGDIQGARTYFQSAVALDPNNRDAQQSLSHLREEEPQIPGP